MGLLGTIIPAASAQVAHSTNVAPAVRTDAASAQNAAAQNAVVSGQAAVITLSGGSSKRVASHGQGRGVDATFESQTAKEHVEKKVDQEKKSTPGAFKATA